MSCSIDDSIICFVFYLNYVLQSEVILINKMLPVATIETPDQRFYGCKMQDGSYQDHGLRMRNQVW